MKTRKEIVKKLESLNTRKLTLKKQPGCLARGTSAYTKLLEVNAHIRGLSWALDEKEY